MEVAAPDPTHDPENNTFTNTRNLLKRVLGSPAKGGTISRRKTSRKAGNQCIGGGIIGNQHWRRASFVER
jgi:hypothetical protein